MPAGRPSLVDRRKLLSLAHYFYWELKSLIEPPVRIVLDRKNEERLKLEVEKTASLSTEELAELEGDVDSQIQRGWLLQERRQDRIRELKEEIEFHRQFSGRNAARRLSERETKIPGEPEVLHKLLSAATPEEIAEICSDAFVLMNEKSFAGEPVQVSRPNWPISDGSLLPGSLARHATQFLEAKKDKRFPKSERPTTRKKQLWFLSVALAGAVCGVSIRTAINHIGAFMPERNQDSAQLTKKSSPAKPSKGRS